MAKEVHQIGTFNASADLEAARLVTISGTNVSATAAAGRVDGVTVDAGASGTNVPVALAAGHRTFRVSAAGTGSAGARLYAAANGQVTATPNGPSIGTALEAWVDGQVIEARLAPANNSVYRATVTVDSTAAALNSNDGRVTFDTGFGAAPSVALVTVKTVTTGRIKTGFDVVNLSGGSAGQVQVSGVAAGTQLDAGDIVEIIAFP